MSFWSNSWLGTVFRRFTSVLINSWLGAVQRITSVLRLEQNRDDPDNMPRLEQPSQGGGDQPDAQGQPSASGGGSATAQSQGLPTMSAAEFTAECYSMKHKVRGTAIIFNHEGFESMGFRPREGTQVDCDNLSSLFKDMGFETEICSNLSTDKMKETMNQYAAGYPRDADCFACAILSYGDEGIVYGKDGKIQIDELLAPFKGDKCGPLAGKPKLFFIQACPVMYLEEADASKGVEVSDGKVEFDGEVVQIRRIPTEADFLMAYSVVPGFHAWRLSAEGSPKKGSWFIQALCDVFRKNWQRMDVMTMMTRVCNKVAYDFKIGAEDEFKKCNKQVPCITSMLTRDLIFTPCKDQAAPK